MAREPVPTWYFVLVVVRQQQRFLLVQERKHGQLWYLPAGRVEPGETVLAAARRETLEEAGIPVVIDGILRVEHTPFPDGTARLRVIVTAHPADDTLPKSQPDSESLRAAWLSLADFTALTLRGEEVRDICEYVARGGPVYPLHLLTVEGAPFP